MSLVAWYPLSGDTNDYSGNEHHLEIVNGSNPIVLTNTGKTGKSYYKPVTRDSSCMKTKRTIDVSGDVSMSCWAYIEDNDQAVGGLVSNHNHGINMGWGINCTGSGENLCFTVNIGYGDSREYNLKKSKPISINKWNHFTFTYNNKTNKLKFYVDGEYDKEFTLDKTPLTQPDFISIFSWSNGYNSVVDYRIKGKIQNVKIYDHTLSIKEVKDDYKTKVVELRFENPVEPAPNNSRISDSSGLGNHARFNDSVPPQWIEESPIGIGSYRFNGNSSLDLINKFLKQDNLKQSWTINSWLRITDNTKGSQHLIAGLNNGVRTVHNTNDGRALLYVNSDANDSYRYSRAINVNEWVNLIFTFDLETNYIRIFLNGEDWTDSGLGPNGRIPSGIDNVLQIGAKAYFDLAKLEIYATPFTLDDAKAEYKIKASIDKNKTVHSNSLVEKNQYPINPNDNLVVNGFLEYGDTRNYNLSPKLITNDKLNGCDCVEFSGNANFMMGELIEINPNSRYELSGYFKSVGEGGLSRLYFGLRCYDENRKDISYIYGNYGQTTKTTLARALNPGDTKVYLNTMDGWASLSEPSHQRNIGFFITRGFPDYKFTKVLTKYSDMNTTEKSLTIPPWNGEVMQAGTKVANCRDGSTYLYLASGGGTVPTEWTKFSATIKGFQTNGEDVNKFRLTTKYVQVSALINYQQNDTFKTRMTHLCLRNLDTNEVRVIKPGEPLSISKKSEFICNEFDTVGPTTGLIFWSDLEYDGIKIRSMTDIKAYKYGAFMSDVTPQGLKVLRFNQQPPTENVSCVDIHLDGVSDIMKQDTTHKSFTLHAAVKIPEAQMPESMILAKSGYHMGLTVSDGIVTFRAPAFLMDGSDVSIHRVTFDISSMYGQWITLTGVYEVGQMTLYVNGIKRGTTSIPPNKKLFNYDDKLRIGGMSSQSYRFKGSITDVRVYERAISDKEALQLYNLFLNKNYSINKIGVIQCNDINER